MIIVGVDPGASGAITILNTYNFQGVVSLPFAHNSLADIYLYLSEVRSSSGRTYLSELEERASLSESEGRTSEIRGGEVHTRAQKVSHLSSLKKVQYHRHTPLTPDSTMDNTMEMYLEEPGQIIVNSRIKKGQDNIGAAGMSGKSGRDNTGALLAGMTASRKLGRSVGQWEGIATALNISCILVPPKKWQSALNCPTRGDKNISKNLAIRCFPFLTTREGKCTITHDIADSLLLALYGYLQYATPKYIPLSVRNNTPTYSFGPNTESLEKENQNDSIPRIPNRPVSTPPNPRPSSPPRRSRRTPPLRPS